MKFEAESQNMDFRAFLDDAIRAGVTEGLDRTLGSALRRQLEPVRLELARLRAENLRLRAETRRLRAPIAHSTTVTDPCTPSASDGT